MTQQQKPALTRALQVSSEVVAIGFEWENIEQVWDKIHEEMEELRTAIDANERDNQTEELGDLLFSVVNLGRWLGIDSEAALHKMLQKFQRRFAAAELLAQAEGTTMEESNLEKMERFWEAAKRQERNKQANDPPGA